MQGQVHALSFLLFRGDICAHSRSRKTGCTRCIDVCPASAITSQGDTVHIDPVLCGGCVELVGAAARMREELEAR